MHSLKIMLVVGFSAVNISLCVNRFSNLDKKMYEDGRNQYDIINRHTSLPIYGQCWKDALVKIQTGCRELTDVVQSRLALLYLNCFLQVSGKTVYTCDLEKSVHECTQDMTNTDLSTYATFFTQTHNICYFLEAKNWQNEAEQTISKLATSSANMVEVLEESAVIQEAIVQKQNVTLENQDKILTRATNLSNIVATASTSVLEVISTFEQTTFVQRHMMNELFDKIAKLQIAVLGGFSRFYSLIYYSLSILMSCLLTSARRTAGARFWLLAIMTVNIVVERLILSYYSGSTSVKEGNKLAEAEIEETVYSYQWICRQVSAILSLAVLVFYIYIYRNLSVINNQLLLKLKKQNSELKHQIKELSKEISIIRHCVMNQPMTDSDDSDGESSRKQSLPLKKAKKTKSSFRSLSENNDDSSKTTVEFNNQDLGSGVYNEESDDDLREEYPTTSGSETLLTTSVAKESTAGTEEPLLTTEVAVTALVTGQPIATSVTERPETTSITESTSGIERTLSGETPQSRYSLRSSSRRGSPT